MEDDIVNSIRESYDELAEDYTQRIAGELKGKPLDRKLLTRFVQEIKKKGKVCDVGCGPGHVARYLNDAGAHVFGLDISPKMVEQARRQNPDLEFREGNMLSLDLRDSSLAGMVAFYAICNIPKEFLTIVFKEMNRVLQPGGLALIAFHTGAKVLHESELWGHSISMDFFLYEPLIISQMLEHSGFSIEDIVERPPYAPVVEYQSNRAYIFARKT